MASIDFINECKNYANCNRYGKLILGEPTTAEISSSVSITNAQASRLLEAKMTKLSTQEGTPTPSEPIKINTVKGYRNLFDESQLLNATNWNINNDGYYNGTFGDFLTAFVDGFTFDNTFETNTQYTLSFNGYVSDGNAIIRFVYTDDTYSQIRIQNTIAQNLTLVSEVGKTVSKLIGTYGSGSTQILYLKNLQLVKGNQALSYVPYGNNWIYEKITGKNLNSGLRKGYYNNSTGVFTSNNSYTCSTNKIKVNATKYIFSLNGSVCSGYAYTYDSNNNYLGRITISNTGLFQPSVNVAYFDYAFQDGSIAQAPLDGLFQIEKGSTPTTYEAYKENIITLPLNDNEICGIGDYKDEYIVDKNGHCWLNKKTKKVVLDGTERLWAMASNGIIYNYDNIFNDTYLVQNAFSNYFENVVDENITGTGTANSNLQNNQFSFRAETKDRLFIKTDIVSNIADFKTWLSTHNLIVYYVLATPQLIDLNYDVDLTLFEGTNNISNSEDMDMEIIYKASVELNQSNKIQEFTIDSGCYDNGNVIGSVYVKKLNAQLIDALDNTLEDVDCDASVGLTYITTEEVDDEEVETETTEYMNMGSYVVEKPKDEQTTNFSSFVAYDLLMNHLEEKYSTSLDYDNETITIADVYDELCSKLGLTPVTTTFTNSTITVENNPFNNGEINRTVLQAICKVACAFVDIDYDTNEIDLKWLSNTLDYTFQKSDYSTVEGGKTVYGPVNSLIIKNSVIDSENVSHSDSASILQNGEHQLVISEDYFLYNQEKRTEALTNIWDKVNGLTYTESTLNTQTGKPFLKVGSKIRIYTDTNEYFDSYVLQNEFKYNGYFSNVIKCPVLTEQEVQTKQNVDIGYKVRQAEIIIDKQGGTIEEITGQINDANTAIGGIRTTQDTTQRRIDVISSNIDENGNITEVTTITGFTFNASGLHISGDGFEANHTSQGTYYKDGDAIVGQYTKDGSKQKDLELFGIYSYGKNNINDDPMFVAQLYTDENGEEGFGHFYSGGDL